MTQRTASGLVRRTVPAHPTPPPVPDEYPVSPTGAIRWWPPGVDRVHQVVLTENDGMGDGRRVFGHRRPDGSHYNTVANRTCTHCVVEAELTYLRTAWAAEMARHAHEHHHRWWPGR